MRVIPGIHPFPNNSGSPIQNMVSFTPGRVNLIGEHTDYNGGMVLPAALDSGLRYETKVLHSNHGAIYFATQTNNETLEISVEEISYWAEIVLRSGLEKSSPLQLTNVRTGHWARYVLGSLALFEAALLSRKITRMPWSERTLSFVLDSNLPQGAGLSSSAALCISLLGQLNFLSSAPLDAAYLARLAMFVEHRFAGTHCGLMDQLAVLCSRANHFTCIDFLEFPTTRNFTISYVKAHKSFQNHALLIFKTGVNHTLAESAYNERRASCEAALECLNKTLDLGAHSLGELARLPRFQGITTEDEFLKQVEALLEGQTDRRTLARRATHAMLENSRVLQACKALSEGNLQMLSGAMRASHASLDSLYEVTCPELNLACQAMISVVDELCQDHPVPRPNALIGPRMTGGGFGGSTVQLVHTSLCDELRERFSKTDNPYTQATGHLPEIFITKPSAGFSAGLETIESRGK